MPSPIQIPGQGNIPEIGVKQYVCSCGSDLFLLIPFVHVMVRPRADSFDLGNSQPLGVRYTCVKCGSNIKPQEISKAVLTDQNGEDPADKPMRIKLPDDDKPAGE